ncbi:ATP-binding cassette domain-containing protein [Aeromicrobium sp. SMF47]|nr:ATP-binding cassette domain-containing protein [Aeromicrobium yanjiei]
MSRSLHGSTSSPAAPVLEARGIHKAFSGVPALQDAALVIEPGEVHGLLGANGCGKSTLIKILSGFHPLDEGTVRVNGADVTSDISAAGLRERGLSFVHQDLGLTADATVVEHFVLRPENGQRLTAINWRAERARLTALLAEYELDVDLDSPAGSLSPIERAQVAIIRALDQGGSSDGLPRLLVLDEPTVFLPRHDVERLKTLIVRLRDRGDAVLLVSHDLDEVLEMADRVTVLRDGRNVGTVEVAGLTRGALVQMILGNELRGARATLRAPSDVGSEVLRVKGLSGVRTRGVDLALRSGEVVGLTGLAGSGYEEVADLLYGSQPATFDRLEVGGREVTTAAPRTMIESGVVLVPADRKTKGGATELSVLENMALPLVSRNFVRGRITWAKLRESIAAVCASLKVKPQDPEAIFRNLSGGNQQKTIIGKWLEVEPDILLLNEPTQGVDVGARAEIFALVRRAVDDGAAALCATSDYEQLLEVADRVIVFREGRVWSELSGDHIGKDEIASAVYGY